MGAAARAALEPSAGGAAPAPGAGRDQLRRGHQRLRGGLAVAGRAEGPVVDLGARAERLLAGGQQHPQLLRVRAEARGRGRGDGPEPDARLAAERSALAATLALHHWQQLPIGTAQQLQTKSGPLRVELQSSTSAAIDLPSGGLKPRSKEPWMQPFQPLQQWTSDLGYGVLLLDRGAELQQLNPDDPCWANTSEKAWVVMQPCSSGFDYQLRFFAPGLGLREDPVTGSAHALVAPWWCEQLGQASVSGWQPSHRPGGLCCEPLSGGMIRLTGHGAILWDGFLRSHPAHPSAQPWLALHPS